MNRQRLVLAGLVAVFAASLLYAFWAMPRQETAPPRVTPPKPVAPAKAVKPAPVGKIDKQVKVSADRLMLELLNQEPRQFPGAGRDIFRLAGGAAAVAVAVEPVEVEPPPEPPKPPPTPEEILRGSVTNITFLGFLEKRGTRTVFLTSGDDVYLVKAGERFGKNKELIAKEITAKQLVVGWVDGPETVKVQLMENEKLQPTTIGDGAVSREPAAGAGTVGGRSRPLTVAPRRLLMPQRAPSGAQPPVAEAPPEEPVVETVDQPEENISQEELLKQGLPSGE